MVTKQPLKTKYDFGALQGGQIFGRKNRHFFGGESPRILGRQEALKIATLA